MLADFEVAHSSDFRIEKTAEACEKLETIAYHYSEIGIDDLKQIVQSAVCITIGTAIAHGTLGGMYPREQKWLFASTTATIADHQLSQGKDG